LIDKYQGQTAWIIGFQSLFYWNCRLIQRSAPAQRHAYEVSILILLELPFDQSVSGFRLRSDILFQSLFYWNCRLISISNLCPTATSEFQSLFYWNCRLIIQKNPQAQAIRVFQSLFYWNCRLIPVPGAAFNCSQLSFNPYFIGIAV